MFEGVFIMFLDTMTYSMMIVAAVLSFITALLTLFSEDSQDGRV